jgi:hypothetical protein
MKHHFSFRFPGDFSFIGAPPLLISPVSVIDANARENVDRRWNDYGGRNAPAPVRKGRYLDP